MTGLAKPAIALVAAGIMLIAVAPGFAAGGGGGGGGGSLPSQSAPAYDPAVEYQKGVQAFRAANYADAARAFKRVTSAMPKNAAAQYLLGASLMAQGQFKKAKSPLEAAVKHDGKMIEARRDLGIVYAKLGTADKAQAQMATLTAMQAACTGSCTDTAKLTDAVGKLEAAIAAGKQAAGPVAPTIRLAEAQSADATYVTAVSLINEKRYPEAIAMLEDALWATGPHPDVLTYLGFANRKLRRFDSAEFYYNEALAVAPEHRGALEYYGELKLERGNVAGARAHLARLESICGFGCAEADELRRWIREAAPSAG
jgi:tetratricopeptide (TPR) repeat protein